MQPKKKKKKRKRKKKLEVVTVVKIGPILKWKVEQALKRDEVFARVKKKSKANRYGHLLTKEKLVKYFNDVLGKVYERSVQRKRDLKDFLQFFFSSSDMHEVLVEHFRWESHRKPNKKVQYVNLLVKNLLLSVDVENRKCEEENIQELNLRQRRGNILFSFFDGAILVPFDVMKEIFGYLKQNKENLNVVGLVNVNWYTFFVISWESVRVTKKNALKIPIIVLQNVSIVTLCKPGLIKFQMNHVLSSLKNVKKIKICFPSVQGVFFQVLKRMDSCWESVESLSFEGGDLPPVASYDVVSKSFPCLKEMVLPSFYGCGFSDFPCFSTFKESSDFQKIEKLTFEMYRYCDYFDYRRFTSQREAKGMIDWYAEECGRLKELVIFGLLLENNIHFLNKISSSQIVSVGLSLQKNFVQEVPRFWGYPRYRLVHVTENDLKLLVNAFAACKQLKTIRILLEEEMEFSKKAALIDLFSSNWGKFSNIEKIVFLDDRGYGDTLTHGEFQSLLDKILQSIAKIFRSSLMKSFKIYRRVKLTTSVKGPVLKKIVFKKVRYVLEKIGKIRAEVRFEPYPKDQSKYFSTMKSEPSRRGDYFNSEMERASVLFRHKGNFDLYIGIDKMEKDLKKFIAFL